VAPELLGKSGFRKRIFYTGRIIAVIAGICRDRKTKLYRGFARMIADQEKPKP
jgi:hypothetical protein